MGVRRLIFVLIRPFARGRRLDPPGPLLGLAPGKVFPQGSRFALTALGLHLPGPRGHAGGYMRLWPGVAGLVIVFGHGLQNWGPAMGLVKP